MVALVRAGRSMRAVARVSHVALRTVQRWVERARGRQLSAVVWSNQSTVPHRTTRTPTATEDRILDLRHVLKTVSDLGEYGAAAIHRALLAESHAVIPTVRTIGRIVERRGGLDGWRRIRRAAPPRGWYLPDVAAQRVELDCFDFIQGLVIQGGPEIEVLTSVSLHGGIPTAWPAPPWTAARLLPVLLAHWRDLGRPGYAQFDNDMRFQGPRSADVLGRIPRVCLALGVVPIFAPPYEPAFQAALENLNGRWQTNVWARWRHATLPDLQDRSRRYIRAARERRAVRTLAAPARRPFGTADPLDLGAQPHGRVIFLRRTNDGGAVQLLGRSFEVDRHWPHRLVRCEVDLDAHFVRFFALRRRTPADQPLLREVTYVYPHRRRFR